jgi:hypothetical protein
LPAPGCDVHPHSSTRLRHILALLRSLSGRHHHLLPFRLPDNSLLRLRMQRVRQAFGRSRGDDAREDSLNSSEGAANDTKKQKSRRPPSTSCISHACLFGLLTLSPRYCFPATAVKGLAVRLSPIVFHLTLIIPGLFSPPRLSFHSSLLSASYSRPLVLCCSGRTRRFVASYRCSLALTRSAGPGNIHRLFTMRHRCWSAGFHGHSGKQSAEEL